MLQLPFKNLNIKGNFSSSYMLHHKEGRHLVKVFKVFKDDIKKSSKTTFRSPQRRHLEVLKDDIQKSFTKTDSSVQISF